MIEYIKHFVSTWGTNGLVSLLVDLLFILIGVFFRQIGRFFSFAFKWIWAIVNKRGKDHTFERAYLNWTINQHRYLGLLPARVVAARWGEEGRNVDLEKVYISLHISTQSTEKNWAETSTSDSSSWRKGP